MSNDNIRSIELTDEPFLWETLYLSIHTPDGEQPPSKDVVRQPHIAKYAEHWGREGDFGLLAFSEQGNPIGAIYGRLYTEQNKGYGFISEVVPELTMAILPEYRGQGIGQQLMAKYIAALKDQGVSAVSLSVDPNNVAIRLYRKFGFKDFEMVGTSLTMVLRLQELEVRPMRLEEADKLKEIDRTEQISLIYTSENGTVITNECSHMAPNWDEEAIDHLRERFKYEINQGGMAFGAFDDERLAGFGVLGHKWRGKDANQLQVDLMYVSRAYRRQGIGSKLMKAIKEEAKSRGAKYLYVSSTETKSAVHFYQSSGSQLTKEVDQELYELEPNDIHMVIEL